MYFSRMVLMILGGMLHGGIGREGGGPRTALSAVSPPPGADDDDDDPGIVAVTDAVADRDAAGAGAGADAGDDNADAGDDTADSKLSRASILQ